VAAAAGADPVLRAARGVDCREDERCAAAAAAACSAAARSAAIRASSAACQAACASAAACWDVWTACCGASQRREAGALADARRRGGHRVRRLLQSGQVLVARVRGRGQGALGVGDDRAGLRDRGGHQGVVVRHGHRGGTLGEELLVGLLGGDVDRDPSLRGGPGGCLGVTVELDRDAGDERAEQQDAGTDHEHGRAARVARRGRLVVRGALRGQSALRGQRAGHDRRTKPGKRRRGGLARGRGRRCDARGLVLNRHPLSSRSGPLSRISSTPSGKR
jgi:hypothetical protein